MFSNFIVPMTKKINSETETASDEAKPLRLFMMELSFDGTDFQGWQIQKDGLTVQGLIQKRLSQLFGNYPIKLTGSSRTDSGVHAMGFVSSFFAPESPYIPDWKVKDALNRLLPPSIRIKNVVYAPEGFHARFSALAKSYTYVINRGGQSPFSAKWSWQLRNFDKLDELRKALDVITGTHDFSSFAVGRSNIDDPVRTIYRTDINEFGDFLCLTFTGNGFLYKMVRSLVGSMAKVGTGRLTAETVKTVLACRNRSESEPTCPPHGLFLMKVYYKENEWGNFRLEKIPFH